MKKLLPLFALIIAGSLLTSCLNDKSVEDEYKEWRQQNVDWYNAQSMRTDYYKVVNAPWDPTANVLIHWHNDTNLTRNNLRPLFTSTVDVKYYGTLSDGTPFDSSYKSTNPRDSIFRVRLSNGVIEGWSLGVTQMRVGDSCRLVIPYQLGYGIYGAGDAIKPFTTLVFDIKLDDIYGYETSH